MTGLLVILLFSVLAVRSEEVSKPEKPVELLPELKNGIENLSERLTRILYKQAPPNSNVVVSPTNIFGAFSLLLYGAGGDTRDEIANFLGFPNTDEKFLAAHKNFGEFLKSLEIKKTGPCDFPESKNVSECIYVDVSIANGVFLHNEYPLVPAYAEGLKSHYSGAVENVDFAKEPIQATNTINKWIAGKTHDLIPDLFKQPVEPSVRIIIAATLYFSAKWKEFTFSSIRTRPETFTTENSEVKVEYMYRRDSKVPYYEGDSFRAISLQYREGDFETMFVLPNTNISMNNFVDSFSIAEVEKILNESTVKSVNYKIPHIETEWCEDLVEPLKSLNMTGIFIGVNLTKLISQGVEPLQVTKVTHSTKLKLDEKGTVATGATTFEISTRSGRTGPPSIDFTANRPFMLIIYHKHSSIPLFTAIIRNPTV